jgi:hypothetical protein
LDDEDDLEKTLAEFGFGSPNKGVADDQTGARWDDLDELGGEAWRPRSEREDNETD